jgi:predicted PurR-regulated permease PerM
MRVIDILGGTFGGFVRLILAVPIATITVESIRTLKRHGYKEPSRVSTSMGSSRTRYRRPTHSR